MQTKLLAIDIGTSAVKVALFKADGTLVAKNTKSYRTAYKKAGWAEQNPADWWKQTTLALQEMIAKYNINTKEIAGIGVDGQSWSAVMMDKDGNVLCPTPVWMDTRAEALCKDVQRTYGVNAFFEVSGNPFAPNYTLPKIVWYKHFNIELFQKTEKVLQSNSYIAFKLTNVYSQDVSQGYGLQCFNIQKNEWDVDICSELGIPAQILPDIYACHDVLGTVTKKAAKETGLFEGTPVVAGGLDAASASLGVGVMMHGETQEQGGQAGGMSIALEEYTANPNLILSRHVVADRWLLQGGTTGGGGVMEWLNAQLGDYEKQLARRHGTTSFSKLDHLAEKVPAGSDGLLFLPYMAGERSPIWNPHAKGVYYGLDFSKTKGHLIRSALEGVAYALKHNLQVAKSSGVHVSVLRSMGGSANSTLWTQMKADITETNIEVPNTDHATTLGSAILAGVGTGVYSSFESAIKQTVHVKRWHKPNANTFEVYRDGYKTYLSLYEHLKPLMKE